jgi:hypothetical protein
MAALGTGLVNHQLVSQFVRRYTRSNMTAAVRVWRGSHPDASVLYEGPARVALLAGAVQMGFGDEPQYMVSGTVYIPREDPATGVLLDVMVNDTVVVLSQQDPAAVGRTMRVMHVNAAGQWNSSIELSVMGAEPSPTGTHRG